MCAYSRVKKAGIGSVGRAMRSAGAKAKDRVIKAVGPGPTLSSMAKDKPVLGPGSGPSVPAQAISGLVEGWLQERVIQRYHKLQNKAQEQAPPPDPSTLDQLYAMLQGGGGHALGGAGLGYGVSKALGGPGWLGAGLGGLAGYLGKDHINSVLGIGKS